MNYQLSLKLEKEQYALFLESNFEIKTWCSILERLISTVFCDCVGIIDGTHLMCLCRRPGEYIQYYYLRKSAYDINHIFPCRITRFSSLSKQIYFHVGYEPALDMASVIITQVWCPGSVHDNQVLRNSDLFSKKSKILWGNGLVRNTISECLNLLVTIALVCW